MSKKSILQIEYQETPPELTAKYRMTMELLRDEVLDSTVEQIADKLSDQFVEKYGAMVMEKAYISDGVLQNRVVEKLSERIIKEYCKNKAEEK